MHSKSSGAQYLSCFGGVPTYYCFRLLFYESATSLFHSFLPPRHWLCIELSNNQFHNILYCDAELRVTEGEMDTLLLRRGLVAPASCQEQSQRYRFRVKLKMT